MLMLRSSTPCACLVKNCQFVKYISLMFLQMSNIHFTLHGNHWALEISNIFFSPCWVTILFSLYWKSCLSSPFSFSWFQGLPFTFCSLSGLSAILQSLYWLILIETHNDSLLPSVFTTQVSVSKPRDPARW